MPYMCVCVCVCVWERESEVPLGISESAFLSQNALLWSAIEANILSDNALKLMESVSSGDSFQLLTNDSLVRL